MRLRRRKQPRVDRTWRGEGDYWAVVTAPLITRMTEELRRLQRAGVAATGALRAFEIAWRDPSPFAFFDAPLTKSLA